MVCLFVLDPGLTSNADATENFRFRPRGLTSRALPRHQSIRAIFFVRPPAIICTHRPRQASRKRHTRGTRRVVYTLSVTFNTQGNPQ